MTGPSDTGIALHQVGNREAKKTLRENLPGVLYCFVVSALAMQYGMDLVIINGAQAMRGFLKVFGYPDPDLAVGYGITSQFQLAITSMMVVGIILGSLAVGPCASYLGRRRTYLVGFLFSVTGNTILVLATNKGAIIFGRIVFGVSNAIYTEIPIIYISEAAPAHLRGALVSMIQFQVCIGTIIGACIVSSHSPKGCNSHARACYCSPFLSATAF